MSQHSIQAHRSYHNMYFFYILLRWLYLFCGGYEGAERKRLVLFPEYSEPDCEMAKISLFRFQGKLDFVSVNHPRLQKICYRFLITLLHPFQQIVQSTDKLFFFRRPSQIFAGSGKCVEFYDYRPLLSLVYTA